MVQPLPSGTPQVVQRGGYFGRYVSSGHVVYLQDDTLFAVPFDVKRLAVTGPAARMIDRVESDATRGSAQLTMSEVGTMAYIEGRNRFDARPIAWMDRSGALAMLRAQPAEWKNPEFSPDGRRLAIDMRAAGQSDIFVYDWDRDTLTRVTFEGTNEEFPVWTPDGTRIIYRSYQVGHRPIRLHHRVEACRRGGERAGARPRHGCPAAGVVAPEIKRPRLRRLRARPQ